MLIRLSILVSAIGATGLIGGCSAPLRTSTSHLRLEETSRSHPIFDARTGGSLDWGDLLAAADGADVIILGEQHDDAAGHAVQQAIVKDLLRAHPTAALSMEMLDRSEQPIVDDYVAGLVDRDRFLEETASTRWLRISREYLAGSIKRATFDERINRIGWPDWEVNYQPMIDSAKESGSRIIAANTPWARYTKLISIDEGYAKLDTLSPAQRALVAWPDQIPRGQYRERYWKLRAGRKEGDPPAAQSDADPDNPHAGPFTDDQVLAEFMKQLVYDATMADSIARALDTGASKVIHLVGQFHSDFDGGTVIELLRRAPQARILTISLIPADATSLREEDRDRADFVIYTGE